LTTAHFRKRLRELSEIPEERYHGINPRSALYLIFIGPMKLTHKNLF